MKTIPSGLLEEAVERLKAEFQPEQIFLFGSHAWGTPDEDSDVDLMVIVSDSRERSIQRMQRAHRCLGGIGFAKDVLVPTRAQVDPAIERPRGRRALFWRPASCESAWSGCARER